MHKRARAHVRAAEKYMYDGEVEDTRKAIAHFGRAMHYFGVNGEKPEPTKEQPVFGFIVDSQTLDGGNQNERIAHLQIDGFFKVLVCSSNGTFRALQLDERRYIRKSESNILGEIGALVKHYTAGKSGYVAHNLSQQKLRVEHMLVGTDNLGDSDALLIRCNNMERRHIILDLVGIVSRPRDGDHSHLASFLRDSTQTTYTLHGQRSTSGNDDKETDVSDHSIVLNKSAADGRMTASLVYVSNANATALEKIKERLAKSKSPLNEALVIYEEGELRDYGILERDMRILCEEKSEKDPLWCWLHLHVKLEDFDIFWKDIKEQLSRGERASEIEKGLARKEYEDQTKRAKRELDDNIKRENVDKVLVQRLYDTDTKLSKCTHEEKRKKISAGLDELYRELTVKYIMIVLRKKALIKEDAAVECIKKRYFVNTDAGRLIPSKGPSGA